MTFTVLLYWKAKGSMTGKPSSGQIMELVKSKNALEIKMMGGVQKTYLGLLFSMNFLTPFTRIST